MCFFCYNDWHNFVNTYCMKQLLFAFAFLLPLHALLVTVLKCKVWIDTDILRFWKEFVIIWLSIAAFFSVGKRYKWKLGNYFSGNYLVWLSVTFAIVAFIYIFFPYFKPGIHSFLGYKYDVFFIFALIAGFSLIWIRENLQALLKWAFAAIGLILIIFLPWYLFFDISAVSGIFGYSSEVSTYQANSCISFSQNVEGEHRFQGTFGWPIRFSVFLIVWLFIYVWYILDKKLEKRLTVTLISVPSLFVFLSIFFSYSKTSMLGCIVWIFLFFMITRKYIYGKDLSENQARVVKFFPAVLVFTASALVFVKRDLFLHMGAMINRLDNLERALGMFLYNPIGYGVWSAGPATQLGDSVEAYSFKGAANAVEVFKYLPENWYVQMLVEMSFIWFFLFIWILLVILNALFRIMKKRKDFFSVGILTSFIILCFMANFTHAFEESATSYLLFLLIWWYIAKHQWLLKK